MTEDLDLIETERLVLSGWQPDQLGDLMRLHGDPRVTTFFHPPRPWTEAEVSAALETWMGLFASRRLGKLRIRRKIDGAFVGRAGFGIWAPTGEAEIGYAVLPEHWGNGYAFEAASGLRDWFFRANEDDQFIGLADVNNTPSLAILTRIGMTPTHVAPYGGEGGRPYQFHVFRRDDLAAA